MQKALTTHFFPYLKKEKETGGASYIFIIIWHGFKCPLKNGNGIKFHITGA